MGCARCGRPVDRDPRYRAARWCPPCFFRRAARRHARGEADAPALRARFDAQGGRCAYTGEPLVLGATASVDHRVPRAAGGTNDPANLQWVEARVNDVKGRLSHEEFVALCRKVAEHAANDGGATGGQRGPPGGPA